MRWPAGGHKHTTLSQSRISRVPSSLNAKQRISHAVLLSLALMPSTTIAATIGASQNVDFSPTVVNNFCDISTTGGSLAVEKKRGLITSDSSESGTFSGTQAPGTITIVSNLSAEGAVIVDPPKLSGTSAPTSSELKIGNGSYSSQAQIIKVGSDGNLASTNLNVRFSTNTNNGKFANGTYDAVATVTCTDNGTR